MLTTHELPPNSTTNKMRKYQLDSLLRKKYLQLHEEKVAGGFQFFYYSYPDTYTTKKNVVGVWKRGVATYVSD